MGNREAILKLTWYKLVTTIEGHARELVALAAGLALGYWLGMRKGSEEDDEENSHIR